MNLFNFFKFLEDKKGKRIPFKSKLFYSPESITPEDLTINGSLDLSNDEITSLPKGLKVSGILNLRGSQITSLPEGLKAGILDLSYTEIISLPKGLKVDNLILNKTPITSLPEGLEVSGFINLSMTPISEKYTEEEIRKMYPGIKGNIFIN